jgi:CheY-like chemotaxis protein
VVVRAEPYAQNVRIVVEDNGTGMEPEVMRRAFEPFFTTKPFGSGTGLGLAVSRGLVASLGGDLRLESEPGKGTRAIVELARAAAPAERDVARLTDPPSSPQIRMLIVDDESGVLRSLQRLLESRYRIELASGVDDGVKRMEAERFDLLLCDVMMPSGGGERLYQTLLARAPALASRVVFFTGGAVTDAARHFLLNQPQPVLLKPLDLEQLSSLAERMHSAVPSTTQPLN